MLWRLLLGIGAITFLWTGVSTAAKSGNECKHVVIGHEGSARFGTFLTSCYSDLEWAAVKDPTKLQLVNAELVREGHADQQVSDPGSGMSGTMAGLVSIGIALVMLALATWPLILIPFALGANAQRSTGLPTLDAPVKRRDLFDDDA